MAGKGDGRRPTQVDDGEFENNWERAFKREKQNDTRKPKGKTKDD
ncbi:MAG: hypothetical protein ACYTFK_12535 [Planctomycetota bacterium]